MLFLVIPPDRVYARVEGSWRKQKKNIKRLSLSPQDVVCGFYRQDFQEFYGKRVNFFELGSYFSPDEDESTLFEFLELCLQEGILSSDSGYVDRIAYSYRLLQENCSDMLFREDPEPWEELSYHGGRTEIYVGYARGEITYYDINSAYAYAMTQPLPQRKTLREYPVRTLRDILRLHEEGLYVLCYARVYLQDYFPPLPVKVKNGSEERTFYPVGFLEGWWSGYDLAGLEWCKSFHFFPEKTLIFERREHERLKGLILSLYSERKSTRSKARKVFLKHAMVQLYGLIGWRQKGFPRNRLVGGFISSFVRGIHYRGMRLADRVGRVLYCDTDSFFVEGNQEKVRSLLPMGEGLGQWGIRKELTEFDALGFKRYLITDTSGKKWVIFSGDRVRHVDEEGRLYWVNPYDGSVRMINHNPQELPPRKTLADQTTYPWSMEELLDVSPGQGISF